MVNAWLLSLCLGHLPQATMPIDTPKTETNFYVVEQMPEFPGGSENMMRWLQKNLEYPSIARENNIEGKVIVQFIVDENGHCINFKVVKSPDPILSEAAVKTLTRMPKWKPGLQNGKPVKVAFTLPVSYKLQ
jgi:protein TonB